MCKRLGFLTPFTVLFTLLAFMLPTHAQDPYEDSLCAYTWQSDINDCDSAIECIDLDEWNTLVKPVPFNISRISPDSLKLCMGDFEFVQPTAIVYIIDLSGSMYRYNGRTVQYPDPNWEEVGDPYRLRDDALEAGFDTQRDVLPHSLAGYIGFGSNIIQNNSRFNGDHLQRPIDVSDNVATLDDLVDLLQSDLESGPEGTNYQQPLDQAIQWLQNTNIVPADHKKAIIFISDGAPNTGLNYTTAQVNALQALEAPVHGVFLGDGSAGELTNLADDTDGSMAVVGPQSMANFTQVIKNIVNNLVEPIIAQSVSIENKSLNPPVIANSIFTDSVNDTIWAVKLNRFLPLKIGPNNIEVLSTFATQSNSHDTTLNFNFYLDITEDERYTNECFYCWHKANIEVYREGQTDPTDTLTWQDQTYRLKFFYFGEDTIPQVKIKMNTANKKDAEEYTLTNGQWIGDRWVFEKGNIPFEVTLDPPATGDDTTEADFTDLVYFEWTHPADLRDSAFDTVIVSSPPNNILMYDQAGDPSSLTPYKNRPDSNVIRAGINVDLYAKVFANTKWLEKYETDQNLANKLTWSIVDAVTNQPNPDIAELTGGTNGNNNVLYPKQARKSVDVTVKLVDPALPVNPERTCRFYIIPGLADSIYIEATNDSTIANLVDPQPWDPIRILANETTKIAYGIIRDKEGNWIRPATQATWNSDNTQVVTVSPGPSDEVTITKGTLSTGSTYIHATEDTLSGTTKVETVDYDIIAIRITSRIASDTAGIVMENLAMETDPDTTIFALGQRSDTKQWIELSVKWAMDPLATNSTPPTSNSRWTFSPSRPDTGIIHIVYDTCYDTCDYQFVASGPSNVVFKIITPEAQRIAGQVFKGEVKISNKDGLVPGIWKYQGNDEASYRDTLGQGNTLFGPPPLPFGITTFSTNGIDTAQLNRNALLEQWFVGGIDTLDFVLYWAATQKNQPQKKHKLTVKLKNLSASTKDFFLHPGPMDSIVMTPPSVPKLTPKSNSFQIISDGYDEYGNYIDTEQYKWSDSGLVDYSNFPERTDVIIFDPSLAKVSQKGKVISTYMNDNTVSNFVDIEIEVKPGMSFAYTRDYSGNGLLDAIVVYLDRKFVLDPNYTPDNILVEKNPYSFTVDSIVSGNPNDSCDSLVLYLGEIEPTQPQTSWRPELTLEDLPTIDSISGYQVQDGASPVIWEVLKEVKVPNDRKQDVVTVTVSENFSYLNDAPFVANAKPEVHINAWTRDSSNTFTPNLVLKGITQFDDQQNSWTKFRMLNGNDLNSSHWFNFNHLKGSVGVSDKFNNLPHALNQKVQIKVKGSQGDINIGPNPFQINFNYYNIHKPNLVFIIPFKELYNWIYNQNQGGTIIEITVIGGPDIVKKGIKVMIIVFDAVGNLVTQRVNPNILDKSNYPDTEAGRKGWADVQSKIKLLELGHTVKFTFYYEGMNDNGMRCAPGVYRMMVYQIIGTSRSKNTEVIAIGR